MSESYSFNGGHTQNLVDILGDKMKPYVFIRKDHNGENIIDGSHVPLDVLQGWMKDPSLKKDARASIFSNVSEEVRTPLTAIRQYQKVEQMATEQNKTEMAAKQQKKIIDELIRAKQQAEMTQSILNDLPKEVGNQQSIDLAKSGVSEIFALVTQYGARG